MSKKWIRLAAALALLVGTAQAGAAAKDGTQAPAPPAATAPNKAPAAPQPAKAKQKLVNLNAASRQELKNLPGGSEEEAARIIAGRPYNSKAFLVTNEIISAARYQGIRTLVVAGQPAQPAVPKK